MNATTYGISLFNRWSGGEANPWADSDWTASWRRTAVNDAEWKALREMNEIELNGVISSIAHLAYHLGAMRQIAAALQGPKA